MRTILNENYSHYVHYFIFVNTYLIFFLNIRVLYKVGDIKTKEVYMYKNTKFSYK